MLYVLRSVSATRSAVAAVNIAVSLVQENLITEREALLRLDPAHMDYFLAARIDPRHCEIHSY